MLVGGPALLPCSQHACRMPRLPPAGYNAIEIVDAANCWVRDVSRPGGLPCSAAAGDRSSGCQPHASSGTRKTLPCRTAAHTCELALPHIFPARTGQGGQRRQRRVAAQGRLPHRHRGDGDGGEAAVRAGSRAQQGRPRMRTVAAATAAKCMPSHPDLRADCCLLACCPLPTGGRPPPSRATATTRCGPPTATTACSPSECARGLQASAWCDHRRHACTNPYPHSHPPHSYLNPHPPPSFAIPVMYWHDLSYDIFTEQTVSGRAWCLGPASSRSAAAGAGPRRRQRSLTPLSVWPLLTLAALPGWPQVFSNGWGFDLNIDSHRGGALGWSASAGLRAAAGVHPGRASTQLTGCVPASPHPPSHPPAHACRPPQQPGEREAAEGRHRHISTAAGSAGGALGGAVRRALTAALPRCTRCPLRACAGQQPTHGPRHAPLLQRRPHRPRPERRCGGWHVCRPGRGGAAEGCGLWRQAGAGGSLQHCETTVEVT